MALIKYRPTEALGSRVGGVVCILALFLLGTFQLFGFLSGVMGKSLGSSGSSLDATALDDLITNAAAIERELGRPYVTATETSFSLASKTLEPRDLKIYLTGSDPENPGRLAEIRAGMARPDYQTKEAILKVDRVGGGGTALRAQDIQRILASKNPPETVETLTDPRPWQVSKLLELVSKQLVAVGEKTPFKDLPPSAIPPGKMVGFSTLRIRPNEAQQMQLNGNFPENEVVTAEEIPATPDNVVDKPIPAGTHIEELFLHLASHPAGTPWVLKNVDPAKCLMVPLYYAQENSVLCEAIYEPTALKLEENIVAGGKDVVTAGTTLTKELVTEIRRVGYEKLGVDVDKVTVAPASAVGQKLAAPQQLSIPEGRLLDDQLTALAKASFAEETDVKVVDLRVRASAGAELLNKVATVAKVLPEKKILASCPGETPADCEMTLAEYYVRIQEFNKPAPEGAKWRQSMDSRALRVRDPGPAPVVPVVGGGDYSQFNNRLLEASFEYDAEAKKSYERGHITTLPDASQISLATKGELRAWSLTDLSVDMLAGYTDGPDKIYTFHKYVDDEGTELLVEGYKATAEEFWTSENVAKLSAAIEKTGNWLTLVGDDGEEVRRRVEWFKTEAEKWRKILVLEKPIEVEVPTVLVEAGAVVDQAKIDSLGGLPESERWILVRGDCASTRVSSLEADRFEVCDQPLQLTLPAGHTITKEEAELLTAAGVPLVTLEGGFRTLSLDDITQLLDQAVTVKCMVPIKEGGELLAEKGTSLDRKLLTLCQEKGVSELHVSGSKAPKALADVVVGDVAGDPLGIEIDEPVQYKENELGANTKVHEDLLTFLADLHESGQLRLPIVFESADPATPDTIRVENPDDWGLLQRAIPPKFALSESINLRGPLDEPIFKVGANYRATWAGLLAVAFLAISVLFLLKLTNMPRLADLLIDTESEMKKVSWPTRTDLIGSSQVVVVTIVALCVYMIVADFIMDRVVMFILV